MGTLVQFSHTPNTLKEIISYLDKYNQVIAKPPFTITPHLDYGCITLSDKTGSVHLETNGIACLRGSWLNILKEVEKVFYSKATFLE